MRPHEWRRSRRQFLRASLVAPVTLLLTPVGARTQTGRLRATPACGERELTPAQTEGPYFKPRSPARASLLDPETSGTRIVIDGAVRTTGCAPIPRALLDFWQADDRGRYDDAGYRLRGHQFTDDSGRYRLETVVPGVYPGRTRHIHVKVQAPEQPVLTTQLYFPGEPMNRRDGLFDPALVVTMRSDEGARASFEFVLALR